MEDNAKIQAKNAIEYYKKLENIEEVPIDILRVMYKDLLKENEILNDKLTSISKIHWENVNLNNIDIL